MHGWAACYYAIDAGICLATVDGGLTWKPVHNYGVVYFGIHFVSPNKGGIVGRNAFFSHVYLTEDNFLSLSYENQAWDYEMHQYATTICYQNDSIIWISGRPGAFYRSTDNGNSFHAFENVPDLYGDIYNIKFYGNIGYAFGRKNTFLKFQDTLLVSSVNKLKITNLELKINPNPASNKVKINIPYKSNGNITIYGFKGNLTYSKNVNNINEAVDISQYKCGVYIVIFIDRKGNTYKQKLIKYN